MRARLQFLLCSPAPAEDLLLVASKGQRADSGLLADGRCSGGPGFTVRTHAKFHEHPDQQGNVALC